MENNLRNEIDIELNYVNNEGISGTKKIHIKFISQAIYDAYSALMMEIQEAITLYNKVTSYSSDLGYCIAKHKIDDNKDTGVKEYKEAVAADLNRIKCEYESAIARLVEIGDKSYTKKFELVKKILIKNSIEDAELFDINWWKECVEMPEIMNFINQACNKDDVESKKKL